MPTLHVQEESRLQVLRLLESKPEMSQRELATALGISLGKANYCLRALLDKGFIKVQRFKRSRTKLAYLYLLTPAGIAEKTALTICFLERRLAEYESLAVEIEALRLEVKQTANASPAPTGLGP